MTFNCPKFVEEFRSFVQALGPKSILEVGCYSGELKDAVGADGIDLNPQRPDVIKADVRDWQPGRKWDLVFSSGLIEHYPGQEAAALLDAMARLSRKWVLTYAPNSGCLAYRRAKTRTDALWRAEWDYAPDELAQLHELAGLWVVRTGYAASEWARRFGAEPSEPYLVFVLAKKRMVR